MTEFANLSEVLNRLSGGNNGNPETLFYIKDSLYRSGGTAAARTSGHMYSMWMLDGGNPGSGVAPTTAAVPTSATRGALPFTNGSGGREKRIISAVFNTPGGFTANFDVVLYDRLFHIGNLSGTSASAQNVQSGSGVSLTRHTGGAGNEIWVEVYTAIGSTVRTVTCSYTNQAGTSGRTTQAVYVGGTALSTISEMIRLPLQAGDTGVQSVETLTLSASTGAAGAFGVTIANRIATIPMYDGVGICDFTVGDSGTYVLEDNACIAAMCRTISTLYLIHGTITTAER